MNVNQMPLLFLCSTKATPLGKIWITASENGVITVDFSEGACKNKAQKLTGLEPICAPELGAIFADQIVEYLAQERTYFNLAIDWSVFTPFQKIVLQSVAQIPYGCTASYKEIAEKIGEPSAARAVGKANATNPLPIIIPCHRVVSTDGSLRGYSAGNGIPTKQWLLNLEKKSAL